MGAKVSRGTSFSRGASDESNGGHTTPSQICEETQHNKARVNSNCCRGWRCDESSRRAHAVSAAALQSDGRRTGYGTRLFAPWCPPTYTYIMGHSPIPTTLQVPTPAAFLLHTPVHTHRNRSPPQAYHKRLLRIASLTTTRNQLLNQGAEIFFANMHELTGQDVLAKFVSRDVRLQDISDGRPTIHAGHGPVKRRVWWTGAAMAGG